MQPALLDERFQWRFLFVESLVVELEQFESVERENKKKIRIPLELGERGWTFQNHYHASSDQKHFDGIMCFAINSHSEETDAGSNADYDDEGNGKRLCREPFNV